MRERGIMLLLAYLAIDQLMTERNVVSPEFNVSSTAQQIKLPIKLCGPFRWPLDSH